MPARSTVKLSIKRVQQLTRLVSCSQLYTYPFGEIFVMNPISFGSETGCHTVSMDSQVNMGDMVCGVNLPPDQISSAIVLASLDVILNLTSLLFVLLYLPIQ